MNRVGKFASFASLASLASGHVGDLVRRLDASGVTLRVQGAHLRAEGPAEVLTGPVIAEIRDHKPELLALLDPERVGARLEAAFVAWREHVTSCPACNPGDLRHRCAEGLRLADVYHAAWCEVYVVPFGKGGAS